MSALTQTLIREIESASGTVQREVLAFVLFLKSSERNRSEGRDSLMSLAQTALGPGWDSPGEDEAWRDL